jgi:hypothetical protein
MSYSFSVSAASKADAKSKVAERMAEIVASQPNHKVDQDAAVSAANAFIDVLHDPEEGQQVNVSMSGSVGWKGGDTPSYTHASTNVSATIGTA